MTARGQPGLGAARSTSWNTRESVELEQRGRPTVTLVTRPYEDLLDETAASEGLVELRRIVLPFPLEAHEQARARGRALGSRELAPPRPVAPPGGSTYRAGR